jgi:hypothetical protein
MLQIISEFEVHLKSGPNEPLEASNFPFFHIGGAGTHYPRRDQQYPPITHLARRGIEPEPYPLKEVPHQNQSLETLLRSVGCDGEWFDSRDVEGYIEKTNIFLNPYSSLIELPQFITPPIVPSGEMCCVLGMS